MSKKKLSYAERAGTVTARNERFVCIHLILIVVSNVKIKYSKSILLASFVGFFFLHTAEAFFFSFSSLKVMQAPNAKIRKKESMFFQMNESQTKTYC